MTGVHIRGAIWLPPPPRRRIYTIAITKTDVLAIVSQGETTPWAWARLPGVSVRTLTASRPRDTVTVDRSCEHYRGDATDPCACLLVHRIYASWSRRPWLTTELW